MHGHYKPCVQKKSLIKRSFKMIVSLILDTTKIFSNNEKIAQLMHIYVNGFAPKFLVDLSEVQESCRVLRSNKEDRLKLPMTRTKIRGTRALTHAVLAVLNSLLDNIDNPKSIGAPSRFLKRRYFEIAFNLLQTNFQRTVSLLF